MSDLFCEECRKTTSGRCGRHSHGIYTITSGGEAVADRVPSAWSEFGDGHDYSRTGKHDPNNCRYCLRLVGQSEEKETIASLRARLLTLEQTLRVIQQAMRGDEQAQCWTIRKWLDERDIFNGDIQGRDRLVYEACKAALAASRGREPQ